MFVFPAFDSNYKTRKRTFKCCRICRSKRMKCIISLTDYESVGCDNCQKHGFGCDLIQADYKQKSGVKGPIKSEKRDETRDTETPGSNPRRSRDSSRDSRDQRSSGISLTRRVYKGNLHSETIGSRTCDRRLKIACFVEVCSAFRLSVQ
jgi:hypothetical protein